ncbi:unnamed protein product [Dibothriocephalus latus]|uniref:Uncharacterized protein n=1 Tax=Dibothriocephalus latus TaxID=60516 RepID=A0A3P7M7T4_DIBLA|nr:unnamed protein product [Dibothriocephalus latus]
MQTLPGQIYTELFYKNLGHMAKSGRCELSPDEEGCDVFFQICIWKGTAFSSPICDVGRHTTRTFEDAQNVILAEESFIQFPLKNYPPPMIRLRVEAWDKDRNSPHDHIVSFVSEVVELDSRASFKGVKLIKVDETPDNKDVQ